MPDFFFMNRLVKYPNGSPFLKSLHSHYGEIKHGSRKKAQMDRGKNFFEKKSFPHPFQKTFIRKASSRVPQNEALTR